ncbi:transposase family protein [Candidatus Aminicenantes bacterium AC-334-K16]|nr:transposase family protein [Candidatus Aminicenantes bacterium AC-334-K16]
MDRKKHYTHALERYVMDLCSLMTILDVARHLGLRSLPHLYLLKSKALIT